MVLSLGLGEPRGVAPSAFYTCAIGLSANDLVSNFALRPRTITQRNSSRYTRKSPGRVTCVTSRHNSGGRDRRYLGESNVTAKCGGPAFHRVRHCFVIATQIGKSEPPIAVIARVVQGSMSLANSRRVWRSQNCRGILFSRRTEKSRQFLGETRIKVGRIEVASHSRDCCLANVWVL